MVLSQFNITLNCFVCFQIFAVGEGSNVSHCLHGGTVKAQIPCTPSSLNTLALNLKNTEHRVGAHNDRCIKFINITLYLICCIF